jgi:hypothetical protein
MITQPQKVHKHTTVGNSLVATHVTTNPPIWSKHLDDTLDGDSARLPAAFVARRPLATTFAAEANLTW